MGMSSELTRKAEQLLEQAGLNSDIELTKGKHSLSRQQVLDILTLRRIRPDATQQEIAAFVGCAQSTVSRWLADYTDTIEEAQKVLQASALPAAVNLQAKLHSENDKVSLEASKAILTANKLLGHEDQTVKVGLQVVIGMPSEPAE